jgi:hypothetical protein
MASLCANFVSLCIQTKNNIQKFTVKHSLLVTFSNIIYLLISCELKGILCICLLFVSRHGRNFGEYADKY